ncbi:CoA ester lyase [Microbacterium sp. SLBN-146]|uniref:HpcH/HpaI aldolase/citrate lyase family protein n=1 Tax=Microbacterium sp. SLBN-146 TaxID=2768457 RepID=UPI001153774C|nr:CoA ester lyase [Microbacterium sp. SLBN-146]TQJ29906.1 citrate lyase subunit beta/citryl-CoA lyase [Microbacterium sp. SLBN-146]
MIARSYLYVPANRPALYEKADAGRADAVILDLEDAVPLSEKAEARASVAEWLGVRGSGGKPIWVRVNAGDAERTLDLAALASVPVAGLVLAKADAAGLSRVRASRTDGVALSPLLETPAAVLDVAAIAASPDVAFIQIGEYDLAAEVGVEASDDESELLWARSQVVFASAARGIAAPVGPVSVEIADLVRFESTTRRLARLGFVGRACIHPAQVDVVNRVFTPDEESVRRAREAIALFDAAVAEGTGVVKDADGRLVDEATIRGSRAVLALASAGESAE